MSEKFLCPRLADYLVIVGSRSPHHSAIQPPELLRRYPLDDHKVSKKSFDFGFPMRNSPSMNSSQETSEVTSSTFL